MADLPTAEDVKRGWTTSLDDTAIDALIVDATEEVYGYLEDKGFDPDTLFAEGSVPRTVRWAIINATRCAMSTVDLSGRTTAKSIQEATEKITYASTEDGPAINPCAWREILDGWVRRNGANRRPMIGTVTKRVGHTIVDDGAFNEQTPPPPEV